MSQQPTYQSAGSDVDLTNCDREPIHILGSVQAYGCLISTSFDFMVNHISANAAELLGIDTQAAIGQPAHMVLPERTLHDLRSKLQVMPQDAGVGRLFGVDVMGNGTLFDASVHVSGRSYIFEFEPKISQEKRDEMALVQPLVARIRGAGTVQKAVEEAALAVQILSDFDRVMVYKFANDGTGEVIAERRKPNMESFLGLRYPASDIPKQARALYKRSLLRLISDVDGEVAPIMPPQSPHGEPLDLSLATTRAVSPIHLEYLRNMGVAASMSVSILKDGELWGLFACHHNSPRYVDYERRTAIELFAQFFSYELLTKSEQEARKEEGEARRLHDRLMVRLSRGEDLYEAFDTLADELAEIVPSDGICVYSDGRYVSRGLAPSEEEFLGLGRFLNTAPTGQIFATDNLAAVYPGADTISSKVAGLLAVPISRTPRDYIIFFRQEIARAVRWAGNPEKPVSTGPNGIRLTPRKSFDAWQEIVRGTCEDWTDGERRAAEALRVSLIEIVLKLADEANLERRKAGEKQELLIAELNHRVRNILNLISGLVSQSRQGADDVELYTTVLDGRIQSMARAHDQLTQHDWNPTSMRELINIETSAFLSGQGNRIKVTGDAPMLSPEAFSTMALVIHEMVTNSAKYGALQHATGTVHVDLSLHRDGSLKITWRDQGGPPVQVPTRRGFGSTIIENTIPYELNGTVETRYKVTGYEADIMIPSRFVSVKPEIADDAAKGAEPKTPEQVRLSGDVMVVEDNMIIALDAAAILENLGADGAHMANSVDDALSLIEAHALTFAVLDVNLGSQTSLPVALKLAELGVPFILATGYGDMSSVTGSYPDVPVVKKPFTGETLKMVVGEALALKR